MSKKLIGRKNRTLITAGLNLLMTYKKTLYKQKQIQEKLKLVGYPLSEGSISNLKKLSNPQSSNRPISKQLLQKAADGLAAIIEAELCLEFDEITQSFSKIKTPCSPIILKEKNPQKTEKTKRTYTFYPDGRLPIKEKVRLIKTAQREVNVLGVRLNSFANYFETRSDQEFRTHILEAMERGVNLNCYLLNPKSRFAHDFFKDRAKKHPLEIEAFEDMPKILKKLQIIQQELNNLSLKGKMRLFQYQTYPYFYALTADLKTPTGGLQISSYLYAVKRSNTPVLEVWKTQNPKLFKIYATSIAAFIESAKEIQV